MVNAHTGPSQVTGASYLSPTQHEVWELQSSWEGRAGQGIIWYVLPQFLAVLDVLKCVLEVTNVALTRAKFAASSTP